MKRDEELWVSMQSTVASVTHNWQLRRSYAPSLVTRSEGLTETRGVDFSEMPPESGIFWQLEHSSIEQICMTKCPPYPIRLHQHRVAWLEQLALRVAEQPHVVVNSAYAVTETAGPLPCLQDLSSQYPAMTGRAHPTVRVENAIIDFLHTSRGVDFDEPLKNSEELQAQSVMLSSMVHNTLNPCLEVLRFRDFKARKHRQRSGRGYFSWQAWGEHVSSFSELPASARSMTREEAIQRIMTIYSVIEHQLMSVSHGYLLGMPRPTAVDLLVWDHLMHASTDENLMIVFADFPLVSKYTTMIWDRFFSSKERSAEDWVIWNMAENSRNEFAKKTSSCENGGDSKAAFENPGQSTRGPIALGGLEGLNTLTQGEANKGERYRKSFDTWYRWRMGDCYASSIRNTGKATRHGDAARRQEDKLRRDYERNDENWMATVGIGTFIILLSFGLAGRS